MTCRDIYVQTIWGENPSTGSEKPPGPREKQKNKKRKNIEGLFFVFVTPLDPISSPV